MRTLEAAIIEQ